MNSIWLRRFVCTSACFTLVSLSSAAALAQHFWPVRPIDVALSHVSGILVDFGLGNGGGGFELRLSDGSTQVFWAARDLFINGMVVRCNMPPQCPNGDTDWPTTVTLGSTLVTVTYWSVSFNGRVDRASDQIDVGAVPLSTKRNAAKHEAWTATPECVDFFRTVSETKCCAEIGSGG